jgi:hypothetical protein
VKLKGKESKKNSVNVMVEGSIVVWEKFVWTKKLEWTNEAELCGLYSVTCDYVTFEASKYWHGVFQTISTVGTLCLNTF